MADIFDFFNNLFKDDSFGDEKIPDDNDKNFNKTEENGEDGDSKWKKEVWKSLDGKSTFSRFTSESKMPAGTKRVANKKDLEKLLHQAVKEQDFEQAAKLRDQIKNLNNA